MRDAKGFLQAILDEPEDVGPRLIFADWLKEHGEATRAEFIRVQAELARQDVGGRRRALPRRHRADISIFGRTFTRIIVAAVTPAR
jgi:uncharacterized protein (TIGR02996 family)